MSVHYKDHQISRGPGLLLDTNVLGPDYYPRCLSIPLFPRLLFQVFSSHLA